VSPLSALAASHGITLFGDLKYGPRFKHFEYANPQAPKGGKMVLSSTAAYDSLNPYILKGIAAPGMELVFETLMVGAMDEPQSYYGLIAESVELAEDRSYMDFTLRKQARWHDGEPITAHDVVFSFNLLKEKGHPTYRILYGPIEEAIAIGTWQVRFRFSDTTQRDLPLYAATMPVLPRHYYEEVAFDKTTLVPPLGSGPYKVDSVDQGRSISFRRVEDYWGKDLPVNVGRYNFDVIRYDIYRDETVAVEAIKSGAYDFREEYIARNWATAYNIKAVREGRLIKEKLPHKIPRGMQAFLFNLRKDKYSDPRVREAIGLSMDFEWMNKTLFYGAYDRSSSFFQNTDFMAVEPPEAAERALLEPHQDELPEALFTTKWVMPKTDGSGYPREQLLKAQALLNEAGWEMVDGKRVNTVTGETLSIEFMMRQRTFEKVITGLVRNLSKLGIEANFRYVDDSQYQKRIDNRDFDIISIWWNLGVFFPGNEQMSFWHSSQADVVGSNNQSGLKSEAVDDILSKLTSAHTLEELTPATKALDRVLLWKHVVIPHWHLSASRILHWDKFGKPDYDPPYGVAIDSWWVKEKD
tara:strand:- start:555 stop:2300 length:1746 start_codon:yes stop_codon:yes gene_type:complete